MSLLSPEQHECFQQQGYLIVDPEIPEEIIDGCVADLDRLYERKVNDKGHVEPCRIQDGWKISASCHHIAVWPRLMQMLRELYGREPKPFQTLNFPVGTIQKPHADSVHFNSCPPSFLTGVWVALEDADEGNGALDYWPGSQLLPEFDMADAGADSKDEHYADYEIFIRKAIAYFGLERVSATMKKGQAFLWSSNLIHAGGDRKDPFRTRHSMVTHVYYEGCRYYTPRLSRGLEVCWRKPEWIPMEIGRKPRFRKKKLIHRQ